MENSCRRCGNSLIRGECRTCRKKLYAKLADGLPHKLKQIEQRRKLKYPNQDFTQQDILTSKLQRIKDIVEPLAREEIQGLYTELTLSRIIYNILRS